MNIKIQKINKDARIPKIATNGSACFDLFNIDRFTMSNGTYHKAHTGLVFEIPKGYHVEVYSRSGMVSRGIIIPNAPGIVDSDYRGEIMVMLYGLFVNKFEIFEPGSRIAQARLVKDEVTTFHVVNKLSATNRGAGGFGSTGK